MTKIYGLDGKPVGEVELPAVFSTPIRLDVIRRAVHALQSQARQPYGSDPLAGKRTSAHYHSLRRYRFTMMNRELSRLPRIHGKGASGTWQAFTARFVPHAVKGRACHPPKVEKVWAQKINKKEHALAVRSALAAACQLELVHSRGHRTAEAPIIIVDDFERLAKTKQISNVLCAIGLGAEFERCSKRKIRAGKGKRRGRRYKQPVGPLVIVSAQCPAVQAARNLAGVDVVTPDKLDAQLLAPGGHAGRLLVITMSGLKEIEKVW